MATGDVNDITARLKAALPPWFGDNNPVLNAMLAGIAYAFAAIYLLYLFAVQQSRIATSTGGFLDIAATDFYGTGLPRLIGEGDAAYLARIKANLFKERATRAAVSNAVQAVTGTAPDIVEFSRVADTCAYATPQFAYRYSRYGSRLAHHQALITSYGYGGDPTLIYSAINANRPAGTVSWVSVSPAAKPSYGRLDINFFLDQTPLQ